MSALRWAADIRPFSQTWSLTTLREKLDFVFRAFRVGE